MDPAQPPALSVISAIVTPALLILACSNLITATSNRLSRLLDRVRELAGEAERVASPSVTPPGKRELLLSLLKRAASRALLLQRSMAALYACLGCLILTSVIIGVSAAAGAQAAWLVIATIFIAVAFLSYASALLIRESRIALASVHSEMEYVRKLVG